MEEVVERTADFQKSVDEFTQFEKGASYELEAFPGRIFLYGVEVAEDEFGRYAVFDDSFDEVPELGEDTIVIPYVEFDDGELFGTFHFDEPAPATFPGEVKQFQLPDRGENPLEADGTGIPYTVKSKTGSGNHYISLVITEASDALFNLLLTVLMRSNYQILDHFLQKGWDKSSARAQQLSVLLAEFLLASDENQSTEENRREAQKRVADRLGVRKSSVLRKTGASIWDADPEDNYQKDFTDPLLSAIRDGWEMEFAESLVWDHLDSQSMSDQFGRVPEIPGERQRDDPSVWTDSDTILKPTEVDSDDPPEPPKFDLYFPEEVRSGKSLAEEVDAAIRSGDHIILTGPPGSGKTRLANTICDHYAENHEVSTATSDWTTFDTVGGYRPKRDGDGLRFVEGLFLDCFDIDENGRAANEWLVIDELNRADVDKAFGSLFTILTGETVELPFVKQTEDGERNVRIVGDPDPGRSIAEHEYNVPSDWRLVATMNAVDKASLYRMSYAFVRRFSFVTVPVPTKNAIKPDVVREYLERWIDTDDYDFSPLDLDIDPIDKLSNDVALVWEEALSIGVNFGPGVMEDFVEHALAELQTTGSLGYDQALAAHVLPQFEGRKDGDIHKLFDNIEDGSSFPEIQEDTDAQTARQFAANHLGVNGIAN